MADNLTLNSGCGGATLATDEICETCTLVHYQYTKLTFGPANTATKVTSCCALPVCVKNATLAVTDNCGSLTVDGSVSITGTANVCVQNAVLSVDDNCGALTIDHTNLCNLHSADFDTGAGTDTTPAIGIALPGCGGAVVGGTSSNPVRTDPTGTTTQPVCVQNAVLSVDDNCASITVDNAHLTSLGGAICGTEVQVDVVASLPSGCNAVGDVGVVGRASGGLSTFRSLDLDETEEQVKASGGRVYSIVAFNQTCAPKYLKMYNAPAACVTVGTTPPKETFVIPANADSDGAGFVFACPVGACYCTGITAAATTGIADCNTGAPGCNDVVVNIRFQ